MFAGITALLVLGGQLPSAPQDSALVDGDSVHLFLPPVFVSEGKLLANAWSDDGQYLIVISQQMRVPPADYKDYFEKGKMANAVAEMGVYIASMKTGISRAVWTVEMEPGVDAEVTFFRGSNVAVLHARKKNGETTVLRVTAATSRVETVEVLNTPANLSGPDPTGKYVASWTEEPPTVRFIGQSGNVLRRQTLEERGDIYWTRSGVAMLLDGVMRGKYLTIEPGGGQRWIEGRSDMEAYLEPEDMRIDVRSSQFALPGQKNKVPLVVANLRGEDRRIAVAINAAYVYGGHCDSGVLYSAGPLNLVRPVIQLSKKAFDEIVARDERAEAMAKLSQLGKALLMYESENAGFPAADNLDAIRPYTGSAELLDGFVYHGVTAFGADRSQTEMGFMPCPGGRAVVYQDGHVAFVPDR